MINLNSPYHNELTEILNKTLNDGERKDGYSNLWRTAVSENAFSDGYLSTFSLAKDIYGSLTGDANSFDEWLLNVNKWVSHKHDPRTPSTNESDIVYQLWENFSLEIQDALKDAYVESKLAKKGGLLAFIGGISKCLVIEFEFRGSIPELKPVAVINEPKSVFDFWGTIDQIQSQVAKNALKSILSSGHKIVYHRGVLIHVDRRKDIGVFGPTIDTVLLAEIMAQKIYETEFSSRCYRSMEIGCGNGLITASMARNLKNAKDIFSIDVDFNSIACTFRNTEIAKKRRTPPPPQVKYLIGAFDASAIKSHQRYDLIVCNPPYIPIQPSEDLSPLPGNDEFRPIGGTELAIEIIRSASDILSPGGKLLMVTSNLSIDEMLSEVPPDCSVELPLMERNGYEVLFDVATVLENQPWLEYLIRFMKLKKRDSFYYHSLHPFIITNETQ